MTGKMMARLIDGGFVQGVCNSSVDLTGHRQLDHFFHIAKGGFTAHGGHFAVFQFVHIHQAEIQHVDHARFKAGVFHDFCITYDDGVADLQNMGICQCHDRDLRSNARGISHGDADQWFFHTNTSLEKKHGGLLNLLYKLYTEDIKLAIVKFVKCDILVIIDIIPFVNSV